MRLFQENSLITRNKKNILLVILSSFLLIGCSSTSFGGFPLPEEINGIGDFFSLYIKIQIFIFLNALILSWFLGGELGYLVSSVGHFIWIISERDYGFFIVFMLFTLSIIVRIIFYFLLLFFKSKN